MENFSNLVLYASLFELLRYSAFPDTDNQEDVIAISTIHSSSDINVCSSQSGDLEEKAEKEAEAKIKLVVSRSLVQVPYTLRPKVVTCTMKPELAQKLRDVINLQLLKLNVSTLQEESKNKLSEILNDYSRRLNKSYIEDQSVEGVKHYSVCLDKFDVCVDNLIDLEHSLEELKSWGFELFSTAPISQDFKTYGMEYVDCKVNWFRESIIKGIVKAKYMDSSFDKMQDNFRELRAGFIKLHNLHSKLSYVNPPVAKSFLCDVDKTLLKFNSKGGLSKIAPYLQFSITRFLRHALCSEDEI
jgi:hypothetical protein